GGVARASSPILRGVTVASPGDPVSWAFLSARWHVSGDAHPHRRERVDHVRYSRERAVSKSVHATVYEAYGRELSELLDLLLAGEVVSDRVVTERLVRCVGALLRLHDRHRLNRHGRCATCWPIPRTWCRPWPKRSICTVHAALTFFLQQQSSQAPAQ